MSGAGAALPLSAQSDFKELVRLYDARSYKLAIKLADRIIKSLPANAPSCARPRGALRRAPRSRATQRPHCGRSVHLPRPDRQIRHTT